MDRWEAFRIVMWRLEGLDPEKALKVMAYILIRDDKDNQILIALASAPPALLSFLFDQINALLLLSSNTRIPPIELCPLPHYAAPNSIERVFVRGGGPRDELVYIYMTFGAEPESRLTEADLHSYFSRFGSVERVEIPEQKKQKFGFVKFWSEEAVARVLGEENPHFVRGCCVYVKPYMLRSSRRRQNEEETRG